MRLVFLLSVALLTACADPTALTLDSSTPEPRTATTPIKKAELKIDTELEKEFAKIAPEAKGKVGVAAILIETGNAAFLNANARFPMQSVYKLPIAMAVMEQVRRGELDLDEKVGVTPADFVRKGMASPLRDKNPKGGEFTIRELIRLSLVESDGTASDVQLRILGGADKVQSYLTQIGITDIKVVNTEKEIGRDWETQYENWSSPMAALELLNVLHASQVELGEMEFSMPAGVACNCPSDQEWNYRFNDVRLVVGQMRDSVTGPRRLKGILPRNTTVAHKTGTSGIRDGITAATNDIGLINIDDKKNIAIAVFVSDSAADEKTRELVIAKIAKAAVDRWSKAAK